MWTILFLVALCGCEGALNAPTRLDVTMATDEPHNSVITVNVVLNTSNTSKVNITCGAFRGSYLINTNLPANSTATVNLTNETWKVMNDGYFPFYSLPHLSYHLLSPSTTAMVLPCALV